MLMHQSRETVGSTPAREYPYWGPRSSSEDKGVPLTLASAVEDAVVVEPEKKKREYKDMEEKHEGEQHAKVDMNTVCIQYSMLTPMKLVRLTLLVNITDPVHCDRLVRQGQGRH